MNNDITQHLTLELSREVSKSSLSVKKYDTNSRRVQVTLVNNGGVVKLQNVVMAIVKGTKPDGSKFWNDCMVNGDNIWFIVTTQMINVAGDVECELEVTWKDESVLTTPTFNIHVYETIQTGVESQNEYHGIIQALAEIINNREWAEAAANGAQISEQNSKRYSEDSSRSATNSANSATNAASHESLCKEYRDFTKNYIDAFIKEQEEDNKTLRLANAYTNSEIANVRGDTGFANNLQTPIANTMVDAINSVYSLASEKNKAMSLMDYETAVRLFNGLGRKVFNAGQSVYVATVGVPDLWVYGEIEAPEDPEEEDVPVIYEYTTDEEMVEDLEEHGYIECGYYRLSMLETQKVDLTDIEAAIADIRDRMMYPVGTESEEEE